MVSMAERLVDKPFHLIASHCQAISNEKSVVAYLKANGMSEFAPNFTVTSNGSHPDVKGNGFVPYYIIFDHTGKLHAHHMCGSYHGGDGWKMIEIVDKLLKDAPAVYLGREPFKKIKPIADKVASGKGIGTATKQIDSKLASDPDDATKAELERLKEVVIRYRDHKLAVIERMEGGQPSQVIPELKKLARKFNGTSLAEPIDKRLEALEGSADHKASIAIEKGFGKIVRAFEKVKESKRSDALIEKTVKKLEKLIEGKEELPIAATVEAYLADLR